MTSALHFSMVVKTFHWCVGHLALVDATVNTYLWDEVTAHLR